MLSHVDDCRLTSEAGAQTGEVQTDEVGCQSWRRQDEAVSTSLLAQF